MLQIMRAGRYEANGGAVGHSIRDAGCGAADVLLARCTSRIWARWPRHLESICNSVDQSIHLTTEPVRADLAPGIQFCHYSYVYSLTCSNLLLPRCTTATPQCRCSSNPQCGAAQPLKLVGSSKTTAAFLHINNTEREKNSRLRKPN